MGDTEVKSLIGELRQLSAKVDHLTEMFNRAAYGDGFARCSRHSVRLKHAEDSVELSHKRITDVKRGWIAALIAVVSAVVSYVWSHVTKN